MNNTDTECGRTFGEKEVQIRPDCEPHDEPAFDSNVHVARLEFERVQTIFIVSMFIIIVVIAKMGKSCQQHYSRMCIQVGRGWV